MCPAPAAVLLLIRAIRIRGLVHVLQDIEVDLERPDISDQHKDKFRDITENCRDVLRELEATLAKYSCLGLKEGERVKRTLRRFQWDPSDIQNYRGRIIAHLTQLTSFQNKLNGSVLFCTKRRHTADLI